MLKYPNTQAKRVCNYRLIHDCVIPTSSVGRRKMKLTLEYSRQERLADLPTGIADELVCNNDCTNR